MLLELKQNDCQKVRKTEDCLSPGNTRVLRFVIKGEFAEKRISAQTPLRAWVDLVTN
jgi:hypothetical protein